MEIGPVFVKDKEWKLFPINPVLNRTNKNKKIKKKRKNDTRLNMMMYIRMKHIQIYMLKL